MPTATASSKKYPKRKKKVVGAREISRMLCRGKTCVQVARKTNRSVRWIRMVAKARALPTNRHVGPGSRLEERILRALVSLNGDVPQVAALYRQTPARIREIVARVKADKRSPSRPS